MPFGTVRFVDTFGTRIRESMERSGINESELSDKTDIPPGELYNYLTDAVRTADSRHIVRIAVTLGVSPEWLRAGKINDFKKNK